MSFRASMLRRALAILPIAASLLLAACGGSGGGGRFVPFGTADVFNRTDETVAPEDVFGFFMAPANTGAFTGNLLPGPLPPGFIENVGDFEEGFWDAEADMEFGDVILFDDVFIAEGATTTFEIF